MKILLIGEIIFAGLVIAQGPSSIPGGGSGSGATGPSGPSGAAGASYYVSQSTGNNSNAGTSVSPWQTLAKISATALHPGDSVYLNRGDTWRENLAVGYDGTFQGRITFDAYGSGANPILNGSTVQTGFSVFSGSVYSKALGASPLQVFQTDGTTIVRLAAGTSTTLSAGQWFWASNVLYVRCTDSAAPSTHTIESSVPNVDAVDFNGHSFVSFKNIDVTKSGRTGYTWNNVAGEIYDTVSFASSSWNYMRGFKVDNSAFGITSDSYNLISDSTAYDNLSECFYVGSGTANGLLRDTCYNGGKDQANGYTRVDTGGITVGSGCVSCYVQYCNIHDVYAVHYLMVENVADVGSAQPTGSLITNNTIFLNTTSAAIDSGGEEEGSGSTWAFNLFYSSGAITGTLLAIESQFATGSPVSISPRIYNNTLYMGATSGATGNALGVYNASNPTIENNVIIDATPTACCYIVRIAANADTNLHGIASLVSGVTFDYNAIYEPNASGNFYWNGNFYNTYAAFISGSSFGAHGTGANPLIVNAKLSDFSLQLGSPALAVGIYVSGVTPATLPTTIVNIGAFPQSSKYGLVSLAADFTSANASGLQNITGLSWQMPPNVNLAMPFSCHLAYSQATNVADSFGIQDVTVAPTDISAAGWMATSSTAIKVTNMVALASTTATAIVTATPSVTTVLPVEFHGIIQQPFNASASTINIMVQQATAGDVIVVKKGSYCTIGL